MMTNLHSHAQYWSEDWEEISTGPSGGQASSKICKRRDGMVRCAFVKILNRQNDPERRARFYREATSLETLSHPGVPALIETNARHYRDIKFKLFIVSVFVEGTNLREYAGTVAPQQAIKWVLDLCDILGVCRKAGISHRDVKPENCLISKNSAFHLVDFGLSHLEDDTEKFETKVGQEIGNRFLRLPELSINSANKDDPRTDISGCVGILFYLLTGLDPCVLLDENNRYPHQRPNAAIRIQNINLPRTDRLESIFDQGFQHALDRRFQTIEALKGALFACLAWSRRPESAPEILSRLQERTESPAYRQTQAIIVGLQQVASQINLLTDTIAGSLGGIFTIVSSSNETDARNAMVINRYGFVYSQNSKLMLIPDYVIRHVGAEITLQVLIDGEEEFSARMPTVSGSLTPEILEQLKTFLLEKLESIVKAQN